MRIYLKIFTTCCFVLAYACKESKEVDHFSGNKISSPVELTAVSTILPDAPGHEAYKMNCVSCHSAAYVQMQPDLSEKSWTALVAKMQKTFGAPISDSAAQEVVKYLVAIKGKQ